MKTIVLLLLLCAFAAQAQVNIGDPVPEIKFTTVLNSPVSSPTLSSLKGKAVLLEFWGTWCGSCIVAMPHLQKLQEKFKGKLQIIAVNDETVQRTSHFLKIRPANYWFAVDTARIISVLFPHRMVPHTIVISPEGKLVAVTSPEAVTEEVMENILNGRPVSLKAKQDNPMGFEEIIEKYFSASDTVTSRFKMEGAIEGAPGVSTTWLDDSTFNHRRLTCLNLPLTSLYRMTQGNFTYFRVIDNSGEGKDAARYCVDVIVKNKKDLMPTLQRELAKRFDLQARVEPQTKEVQVLTITDAKKFKTITRNTDHTRTYATNHGQIDQHGMTMNDFAEFLENYGLHKITVNETNSNEIFDIKFSWFPEDPKSMLDILAAMGLGIRKEQRKVDMLILN